MEQTNDKKILFVDDEPSIGELIKILFEMEKEYEFTYAASGEACLKIIEQGFVPDLILLDVMMPGINGFETCMAIRNKQALNSVKIFYYSALPEYELTAKVQETKADGYITKGIDVMEIKGIVAQKLAKG